MPEKEKMSQLKGCFGELREDSETGWKMLLGEITPTCKRSIVKMTKILGPHSRKYLARRLETSNPKDKKALEEMGLS